MFFCSCEPVFISRVVIALMKRLKCFHLPNVTAASELFAHYVEAWESWQVEAANELHKQHLN